MTNQTASVVFSLRLFVVCALFAILATAASAQTTTYTYTGNAFQTGNIDSPTVCPLSGYFTVPNPIPPNFQLQSIQSNSSYSFTDCASTITNQNAVEVGAGTNISVVTGAQGQIIWWSVNLIAPSQVSVTENNNVTFTAAYVGLSTSTYYGDEVIYGNGLGGGLVNIFSGSLGTWTSAPGGPVVCSALLANAVTPHVNISGIITAEFTPQPAGSLTLASAESICGFSNFDWQNTIKTYPVPSILTAVQPSPGCLGPLDICIAPPSFLDPPPGGYTYELTRGYPNGDNSFPFYYDVITNGGEDLLAHEPDDYTLTFYDLPADPCLPTPSGMASVSNSKCGYATARKGSFLSFTTRLVGICGTGTGCASSFVPYTNTNCILQQTCVDLGVGFNWKSTFNGTSGGAATSKNSLPPDPGSGTGGVTITSINGVPQTPPQATCMAAPNTLWPPNGKSVLVTVSGNITAGTSPLTATTYAVIDEYGQDQPSDPISLAAGGSYLFTIPLIAARNGNDKDGRTYTINVTGRDTIGNVGACSAIVTVPHDQGQ